MAKASKAGRIRPARMQHSERMLRSDAGVVRRVRIKTGRIDVVFLLLVLLLLTIGLVMLFSASYANAYYYQRGDSLYYISRQLTFAVMGTIAMFIAAFFDYHHFQSLSLLLMGGSLGLLVLVRLLPANEDGFHRWIRIGEIISFQPSEIAKFAVVVLFAHMLSQNYQRLGSFRYGILPYGVVLGIIGVLLVLEPHLSATVLVFAIGAIMMIVAGVDLKWFVMAGVAGVLGIVVIVFSGLIGYSSDRITYWLHPELDPLNKGFQTLQSLYAIGSGGLLGVGTGNSRQKYLYLPEVQNDFVFSIVGEELGFVGASIIVVLFALLIWRGFVIAGRAKDRFGMLLAVGLTAQVGLQAFLNIAVVTNTIPNTGISLPFFSYGGTSLMMLLGEMGVVLSVSRQSAVIKE